MGYCLNCGKKIEEGTRFCPACGRAVNSEPVVENKAFENTESRQVFAGRIKKCPNCGEVLKAFETNCPSCGCEIREDRVSESIRDFSHKLERAWSTQEKVSIIKYFPIPNTKEALWEFLIFVSTSFDGRDEQEVVEAWRTMLDQIYQKAGLIIKDAGEFAKIEKQCKITRKKLRRQKFISEVKVSKETKRERAEEPNLMDLLPNLLGVFAWLAAQFIFLAIIRFNSYGGGIINIFLIAVAALGVEILPSLFKIPSLLLRMEAYAGMASLFLLCSILSVANFGNVAPICAIGVAVSYVITLSKTITTDKKNNIPMGMPTPSMLLILVGSEVLYFAVYGITGAIAR